jgi:hypothetical protein
MTDKPSEPDTRNLLERTTEEIRNYLTNKDTSFAPAAIGALLGSGASALYTERRKGETPKQRALRTIKNALIGGALGGTGAQLLSYSLPNISEAVAGEPGGEDKDKTKGVGYSLSARAVPVGLAGLIAKNWQGGADAANFRRILPAKKFEGLSLPSGVGNKKTPITFNTEGLKDSMMVKDKAMRQGMREIFAQLKGKTFGAKNKPTQQLVTDAFFKQQPGLIQRLGQGDEALARARMGRWLSTQGVGTSGLRRAANLIDRNILLNPAASSLSRGKRWTGRVASPLALASLALTPEFLRNIYSRDSEAGSTLGLSTPNLGANTEESNPVSDFLFAPREPLSAFKTTN